MRGARLNLILAGFLGFWIISNARPGIALAIPELQPEQREELRTHLESLFNEVDLAIRNQKIDKSDLARSDRDFQTMKVYQRIPMERDIPGLKRVLTESAHQEELELLGMTAAAPRQTPALPPRKIYTDGPRFQLSPEQIAETIELALKIRGKRSAVRGWISHVSEGQLRLVTFHGLKSRDPGIWTVQARAYRFRNIEFPRLLLRDPMRALPAWARTHSGDFARAEPLLWRFVIRTRELEPRARPLFEVRRRFLQDDARMSFFLALAKKPVYN